MANDLAYVVQAVVSLYLRFNGLTHIKYWTGAELCLENNTLSCCEGGLSMVYHLTGFAE